LFGIDNLGRLGSELSRAQMRKLCVKVFHGDLRCPSDVDALPVVDWVVDCAANSSVLVGADGQTTSRQLIEHNLIGTVNLLEYCKRARAGIILLSTSRVYSIRPLATIRTEVREGAFVPAGDAFSLPGLSERGIAEEFSTETPVSLYGATKLTSEQLAREYGEAFGFPVWLTSPGARHRPYHFAS
jgi:CDP-paratose 2-epimerase